MMYDALIHGVFLMFLRCTKQQGRDFKTQKAA